MGKSNIGEDENSCDFCKKKQKEVQHFIAAPENGVLICNECVRACEAIVTDNDRNDIYLGYIPGEHKDPLDKLKPITRLPKKWIIDTVHLYASIPYVTACDLKGKKQGNFSIPKQLAHWIITSDRDIDIDEIKEKIKDEISYAVRSSLMRY